MNALRSFSLICLTLLAALSCKDAEKKTADKPAEKTIKLNASEFIYTADTTKMKGYLVYDENVEGTRPGILVIHEWWGHNEYTRERARMLAEQGYTALAVDMYGQGKQAKHPDEAGAFAGMVMQNMPLAEARFDAALEELKSHPTVNPKHLAAVGYCFGGSVALTMANAGKDLDAVAAFHSGIQLPVMPSDSLDARILVANGADDPMISEEAEAAFKAALDSVGADYEYISYEGATHAYTSKKADSLGKEFGLPLAYNEEADRKSWNKLLSFLENTFKP